MTLTGILLRFNGGHRYIGSPSGAERFIRIDTDHEDMAISLCEEYLALHSGPATSTATDGRVLGDGQVPGVDYRVGDSVEGSRLATFAVSLVSGLGEAGEGGADVGLELGDRLDERVADLERRIARASRGVAISAAVPQINAAPVAKGNDKTPPPYSLGQALFPSKTPTWSVPAPFWVAFMEVTLTDPGTTRSLIRLWKNAEMVGECWIEAGEKRAVVKIQPGACGLGFTPKDAMITEIKVAGADAANLAVVLRGAITGD